MYSRRIVLYLNYAPPPPCRTTLPRRSFLWTTEAPCFQTSHCVPSMRVVSRLYRRKAAQHLTSSVVTVEFIALPASIPHQATSYTIHYTVPGARNPTSRHSTIPIPPPPHPLQRTQHAWHARGARRPADRGPPYRVPLASRPTLSASASPSMFSLAGSDAPRSDSLPAGERQTRWTGSGQPGGLAQWRRRRRQADIGQEMVDRCDFRSAMGRL